MYFSYLYFNYFTTLVVGNVGALSYPVILVFDISAWKLCCQF